MQDMADPRPAPVQAPATVHGAGPLPSRGRWPFAGEGQAQFDPAVPVPLQLVQSRRSVTSRKRQRERRTEILAAIRRLLLLRGCAGVTMRSIAEESGYAVQTIYNLVGPREHAIVEAISEYTRYVGRTSSYELEDVNAVGSLIDQWIDSIAAEPEFCRQVSLIALTPSRGIFYAIRERQMKGLLGLLLRQQRSGLLRPDAQLRDLAEQMAFSASALCVEWADRPFPVAELRRRLCSTFANLLASAIVPGAGRLKIAGP